MIVMNFLVGLPVMLLSLALQVAVSFWSVRYYVHQSAVSTGRHGFFRDIRPLLVAMLLNFFFKSEEKKKKNNMLKK